MPRESSNATASSGGGSATRVPLYAGSNSRLGRHRARSHVGQSPDDPSTGGHPPGSSAVDDPNMTADLGGSSSGASSPLPPPPPPPTSQSSSSSLLSDPGDTDDQEHAASHQDNIALVLDAPSIKRSVSASSTGRYRSRPKSSASAAVAMASSLPTTSSSVGLSARLQQNQQQRREGNGSLLGDGDHREISGESPPTSLGASGGYPNERSRSGSNAPSRRHDTSPGEDTPRRRARKIIQDDADNDDDGDHGDSQDEGNGHGSGSGSGRKPPSSGSRETTSTGERRQRPVRIKYESVTRGVGGGKREISHASLGKLIARLTDAHAYDAEFRDVFLMTYRCFCSPYDFIKKLLKRYTAVLTLCGGIDASTLEETQKLLEEITRDEEDERSSTSTSISTAKSDINTHMEATVSIMRLLSVVKYWIKESGYIEMDLLPDRRAQKKLIALLTEIQQTTPIPSIRAHAESLLSSVAQLLSRTIVGPGGGPQSSSGANIDPNASFVSIPPPPPLSASTSVSSVSSLDSLADSQHSLRERATEGTHTSKLSSAMSKLKLTRSSSDSKKDRSVLKLKTKQQSSGDVFHQSPMVTAPKMLRGVTTGSAEADGARSTGNPLEDVIHDTIQRARLNASRSSSKTSYDNVQPLSGLSAQELADQMTLMEAEAYYSRINPRELTNKAWTRETKYKEAPHVMALIELFDATAEWVSSEILHPQLQAAERAKIVMFFIDAADNCYQMNNFNSLFELITGLSAPCIRQLTTTWGLVSANSQEKYQVLQSVCAPEDNYRNYRQAFALAEGQPRLPCSFLLVKDLFTLEEAMKSIEDGLVNWQKFRKIHKAISEALERQNMNYLPPDGSNAAGISRKGKGALRHDRKVQLHIRHRLDTIRKDSSVLYQLARNANTQESIMFVNSLSEAGFL